MKGEVAFPVPAVMGHEISGTVAELGDERRRPGGRLARRRHLRHAVRDLRGAAARARDDLCGPFFALNRLRGDALRRRDAAVSRGRHAARDVLDGRARGVRGAARDRGLSAGRLAAARGVGDHRLRGDDGLRRGHATAPRCGSASGWWSSRSAASARSSSSSRARRAPRRSSRSTSARRSSPRRCARRDRRRRRSAGDPVARVLELTEGGGDAVFEVLGTEATFLQALGMVRDGGRLVAVGIAPVDVTRAGRDHADRAPEPPHHRLVRRAGAEPTCRDLLALIESGVLTPAASVTRDVRARRGGGGLRGARPARDRRPGDRDDDLAPAGLVQELAAVDRDHGAGHEARRR